MNLIQIIIRILNTARKISLIILQASEKIPMLEVVLADVPQNTI